MARKAYAILETVRNDAGEFIPCIAVEGENGYHKTDWTWGKDFDTAQEIADQKNESLGLSKQEAFLIILSTMKGV